MGETANQVRVQFVVPRTQVPGGRLAARQRGPGGEDQARGDAEVGALAVGARTQERQQEQPGQPTRDD